MDSLQTELIKRRDINFSTAACQHILSTNINPAPAQTLPSELSERNATQALELLESINGIIELKLNNDICIAITYDLSVISMRIIEEVLGELGFNLDTSLLCKMRRAIIYYTEETQLVNMGYTHLESKSTTEIFISQYQQRQHGSRDKRPHYYHHVN